MNGVADFIGCNDLIFEEQREPSFVAGTTGLV
jgi:hypothetical protein